MKAMSWGLALAASLIATAAQADVWGHVDARGVAHFATAKLDARYELFMRGGQAFEYVGKPDSAASVADAAASPSSDPLPPKLQAFFDRSARFQSVEPHLRQAAERHGIDIELLQALIATESGFDSEAVSPKGAIGLMQVLPSTAERWGLREDARRPLARQLTDVRTNLRIGTRYLRHLIDLYPGQLELALAAYNAGEGAVQRAGQRIPAFRETQAYVKTVLQMYGQLKPRATPADTTVLGAGVPARRVRMELPGVPLGGAIGRGNLPAQSVAALPDLSQDKND